MLSLEEKLKRINIRCVEEELDRLEKSAWSALAAKDYGRFGSAAAAWTTLNRFILRPNPFQDACDMAKQKTVAINEERHKKFAERGKRFEGDK